jgi:hypothetical protein
MFYPLGEWHGELPLQGSESVPFLTPLLVCMARGEGCPFFQWSERCLFYMLVARTHCDTEGLFNPQCHGRTSPLGMGGGLYAYASL